MKLNLPCETRPSTTVVIVRPFLVIFVVLVRSAERERFVREFVLDGDADRCDDRDDGRGNEFRPSFILNFTLNIFHFDDFVSFFLNLVFSFSFSLACAALLNSINFVFNLCAIAFTVNQIDESISHFLGCCVAEQQQEQCLHRSKKN